MSHCDVIFAKISMSHLISFFVKSPNFEFFDILKLLPNNPDHVFLFLICIKSIPRKIVSRNWDRFPENISLRTFSDQKFFPKEFFLEKNSRI